MTEATLHATDRIDRTRRGLSPRDWLQPLGLSVGRLVLLGLLYLSKYLGPLAQLMTMVRFAAASVFFLLALRSATRGLVFRQSPGESSPRFDRLLLVIGAVVVSFVAVEAYLWVAEGLGLGRSMGSPIPQEWKLRPVEIQGASSAHYWHGKLFVFDENRMRRTTPFPSKREDVARIVVLGDSLTYGYGVADEDTYPRQLEKSLSASFRVEVLNLGISGASSEDVASTLETFAPRLDPDLIVYGICLNDFLPRGVAEYDTPPFPLIPVRLKVFVASRTRLGLQIRSSYKNLLVDLGFQHDFYDDILKDYAEYRTRFAKDLVRINQLAVGRDLPPVVAMVLEQSPVAGGKGHRIALEAEAHAREAGMTVVSIDEFIRVHDGEQMPVSEWEGHPNEKAHLLMSELLATELASHPALEPYRLDG